MRRGGTIRVIAYVAAAMCSAVVSYRLVLQAVDDFQLDLAVFRDAGAAFLAGAPLYSADFPTSTGFRFIYPPFAAVLFAPMAHVSADVLQVLWAVVNIAAVWWILRTALHRLNFGKPGRVALLVLGPALLLEPVRANFAFGQINIMLMALVVADSLRAAPRRLRGAFIGLAAAIKLTPAGYALVLLARRDRTAVLTAAATFLVCAAVGFALLPRSSLYFWATEFFRDDRAGGHEFSRNQALTGPLARMGVEGPVKDVLWLTAAAAIAAGAYWAARRFAHNGEHVVSLGVVAVALLLAAPFAVNHHWVGCILLVPLLLAARYRAWRPLLATAFAVFLVGPHTALEHVASAPPWQVIALHVVGNAQFLCAGSLFIGALIVARRRGADRPAGYAAANPRALADADAR
ncbi:glycosyltransferase 87 family protein [Mycobacterium sp. IDR2000157661]|uniref:glycosyltransferase 87 family protein n=1 Tax=Mycobacterium sp. IDR2000157661 TaxID=2867005 RepID=UPI001EEDEE1B|nr:glycosyltransferase 87 family protein [Mycobacterium sp. IDR2000157661]ULE34676.1 DUF2029 domain-containing protein [Mycobacterium sp. IDR2000157661]